MARPWSSKTVLPPGDWAIADDSTVTVLFPLLNGIIAHTLRAGDGFEKGKSSAMYFKIRLFGGEWWPESTFPEQGEMRLVGPRIFFDPGFSRYFPETENQFAQCLGYM